MIGSRIQVVVVLFDNVTQLDFTGPAQVFARLPDTDLTYAAPTLDPVSTDSGFSVVPTATLAAAPQADVLFVPGGQGAMESMANPAILDFVRRQAQQATFVTSVCTGSFVLAAAGLLAGRRATSHWASLDMLTEFGATPVSQRVVTDGNIITGAGVSSGIDFALVLAERLRGREVAERIQLQIEYDPQPPFDAGSAMSAPREWVDAGRATARDARLPAVREAVARLAASSR
ncbi:DJ-1/PfpI family protein [Subtercola lobariae]|uniref:Dimethylglycine dehydrogenase n=1 Tax=Subtercola lobariae TaxID=1588641 RepID=A0A917B8R2_9MICO|nr:DJ-1/PfpI family protein [Subtercola lobariae]GGF29188.1 dimethylglycine dehydrogenase [Subtercola lobariae]